MSSPSSFASLFEREAAGLRAGASHRAATSPSLSISLTRPRPTPPSQMTTNTSGPPQHNYFQGETRSIFNIVMLKLPQTGQASSDTPHA